MELINLNGLLKFIEELDKKLSEKIKVIAIGGTALVLIKLKESTKDIDFCVELERERLELIRASKKVKPKFRLDLWLGGYIFSQQLPEDYIKRSRLYKKYNNIELRILNPLDIILTKVGRLNQRDYEDIKTLIKYRRINKARLIDRYKLIKESIPGSDKNYEDNFKFILNEFFGR